MARQSHCALECVRRTFPTDGVFFAPVGQLQPGKGGINGLERVQPWRKRRDAYIARLGKRLTWVARVPNFTIIFAADGQDESAQCFGNDGNDLH